MPLDLQSLSTDTLLYMLMHSGIFVAIMGAVFFLIGLIGKDLHPLSHVVQSMRSTKQTSQYMQQMGPFFVGRVTRRVAARAG